MHRNAAHSEALAALPTRTPDKGTSTTDGVLRISSQMLFDGAREVEIEHGSSRYRLRQTALGKLILTK